MKNGVQIFPDSQLITFVNGDSVDYASGDVVPFGGRYGIANGDIADGGSGTIHTEGQFGLVKGTGYALSQGQRVTWDGAKVVGWTPASETRCMGVMAEPAGTNATEAVIKLGEVPPRVFASEFVVTFTEAALNSNNGRVDFDTGFGAVPSAVVVQVRTVTTDRDKTAFDVLKLTGDDAGTVRVAGVGSGTQLDAGDIVSIIAYE